MNRNALKTAFDYISKFMKKLEPSEVTQIDLTTELFFSFADEGFLALSGEDAKDYREGLKLLTRATDTDVISPKAVEELYQQAIFYVLDISEKRRDQTIEQRLETALSNLEKYLSAPPTTFGIYYPIGGLFEDGLPIQVGKVTFCLFNNERLEELFSKYEGNDPNVSARRVSLISDIQNSEIFGKPVGYVEVNAIDDGAAKLQALKELSLTIDIINFFSDLIPYQKGYLYLPGERERVTINVPVISKDDETFRSFGWESLFPLMPLSLRLLLETDEKLGLGFHKVSEMLKRNRSNLENKLISAIQWAGRATSEIHKEEAFLLYAISLESLILLDNEKDELSYRLRTRIAHLIGKDINGRKEVYNKVKDLYGTRSKIVHSGWFQVTDADLRLMRFYAKASIIRILIEDPFTSMQSSDDLINWFNNQILR